MATTSNFFSNRIDRKTGKQYKPIAMVLHITDGSYESTMNWIKDPQSQVSYNYIVHDGRVEQIVKERHGAWANGLVKRPTWKGFIIENGKIVNPNLYTISVAVANWGKVPVWKTWKAWRDLCEDIMQRHNLSVNDLQVVNHFEINNGKRCPRPFCTRHFLNLLLKFF